MTSLCTKPGLAAIPISEHVSFSDEGPWLKMVEFFEISHGTYQPLNFLPSVDIALVFHFK